MSEEEPVIVKIDRKSVRAVRGKEAKRQCRDADVVISVENIVVKDKYARWPGQRSPTDEEKAAATDVYSE